MYDQQVVVSCSSQPLPGAPGKIHTSYLWHDQHITVHTRCCVAAVVAAIAVVVAVVVFLGAAFWAQ